MAKQCVWILWIGLAAAIVLGSGGVAAAGLWVFGLSLVAHLVEFVLKRSVLERAGGSMGRHFVQTMIYGLFHWRPIEKQLESEAPS